MKKIKKATGLVLAFVLCFSMISSAFAYTDEDIEIDNDFDVEETIDDNGNINLSTTYINPLYDGEITKDDLDTGVDSSGIQAYALPTIYTDYDEAAAVIREGMVARETNIEFVFDVDYNVGSDYNVVFNQLTDDLFNMAIEHTGVGNEGDYLATQYGGWTAQGSLESSNGYRYNIFYITYTMTYFTTAEQEAEVDAKLEEVYDSFNWQCDSDYEKVCDIYNYICSNVTYDYDNLNNSNYKLKYTAYAALINGTSGCQGYTDLLYRMCLDCGLDCRVIIGTDYKNTGSHAWNIVRLGDLYYNADPTWDSDWYETQEWQYFLCSDTTMNKDRERNSKYSTPEFYTSYPMGASDYNPDTDGGNEPNHNAGDWEIVTEASCIQEGYQEEHCVRCGALLNRETIPVTDHTEVVNKGYDATCTTDGLTDSTYCSVCGITIVEAEVIPALGHDIIADKAVAPTCTEDGLTEGSHCGVCGTILTEQEIIPATGHICNDNPVVVEPTCTEDGYIEYTCTVCGETYQENLDAFGHTEVIDYGYDSICTQSGLTEGSHCERCGEILKEQIEIDPIGHNYQEYTKDATCTSDGYDVFVCTICGDYYGEKFDMLEHTVVIDPAIDPTCTEDGLTEGSHCDVCGTVIIAQETIPAYGHVYACIKNDSTTHVVICPNCADIYTEGHHFNEDGVCTDCGYQINIIDKMMDWIQNRTSNTDPEVNTDFSKTDTMINDSENTIDTEESANTNDSSTIYIIIGVLCITACALIAIWMGTKKSKKKNDITR